MSDKSTRYPLAFMDALFYDKKLWFFDVGVRRLCSIEMESGEFELYSEVKFPEDDCRKVFRIHNRVYWVSTKGAISYSELDCGMQLVKTYQHKYSSEYKVKDAFIIENSIWCIPYKTIHPIIVFELIIGTFSELQLFSPNRDILTTRYIGDSLYFSVDSSNIFYEYNVREKKRFEWNLPREMKIGGFDGDGECFWLRNKQGYKIYQWSKKNGILRTYDFPKYQEQECCETNAKVYIKNKDKVFLLPDKGSTIAYVDFTTRCLKRVNWTEQISRLSNRTKNMFSIGNMYFDNKWILFPWGHDKITQVDLNVLSARCIPVYFSEEVLCSLKKIKIQNSPIGVEDDFISLSESINWLIETQRGMEMKDDSIQVGERILSTVLI